MIRLLFYLFGRLLHLNKSDGLVRERERGRWEGSCRKGLVPMVLLLNYYLLETLWVVFVVLLYTIRYNEKLGGFQMWPLTE